MAYITENEFQAHIDEEKQLPCVYLFLKFTAVIRLIYNTLIY